MRILLATTALGAMAVIPTTAAQAQRVINSETDNHIVTAGQDVQITSTGVVRPTSGAAVTINTNNSVLNQGTIRIRGANNSVGILANPDITTNIINDGLIRIDEDYAPTDQDNDGDLDGPFAQGSNRYGIRTAGTFAGLISNSGTITVEGNQSAGISLGGLLDGTLRHTGEINVLGNDIYGIRTGAVTGDIRMTKGSITVQGENAVGILVGGDVGGTLHIQGTVNSTGYRYTSAPANTSNLDSDDLLQGGGAVVVAGSVDGGILLDVRPSDNSSSDTDEDDDGIADAQEGNASLTSLGSAAALAVGSSTRDITIGEVGETGYGLVVRGSVTGNGVYSGINATAVDLGGDGHLVTIEGGASFSGTVVASAQNASATAIRVGEDTTVPVIAVSGTVRSTASAATGAQSRAIFIQNGATVDTLRNNGTIEAIASGDIGTAAAITDRSGTLTFVENRGAIRASGGAANSAIAIDLSANASGVTVRQLAAATGRPAPVIAGNVLLGSGNDRLQIQAGSLIGNVDFGGGADQFQLGGTFSGELLNSADTSVTVGSGASLGVTTASDVNLAALTVNGGSIGVTIGESDHTTYNVGGAATFGDGSTVNVTLQRVGDVAGTYTIIDAGSIAGADNLTTSATLPFLFDSSISSSAATGEIFLDIERKSDAELGLNASEIALLDAALIAADNDLPVAQVFLTANSSAAVKNTLQQLLPEHAGGTFETATRGPRLATRILSDPTTSLADVGGLGIWAQQVGWSSNKSIGSTSSYKLSGWGATVGAEIGVGALGQVGVSLGYHLGKDGRGDNDLISNQYEGGIYWRGGTGPLRGFARAAGAKLNFDSTRRLTTGAGIREAEGDWGGTLYSGTAGAYYDASFGRFSIRPIASLEHYSLKEDGYAEAGGGDGFNLTVDGRKSSETAANGLLALGYELMSLDRSETWLRLELEGGWRQVLSGKLGSTIARFEDGDPFTLVPEERTSGWTAAIRATGGGRAMTVAAELGAEDQQGDPSIGGRLAVQFPF